MLLRRLSVKVEPIVTIFRLKQKRTRASKQMKSEQITMNRNYNLPYNLFKCAITMQQYYKYY